MATLEPEALEDNTGAMQGLRGAAPIFLIASLIALFLLPLAMGARIVGASTQLSDVEEPARTALDVIALTTASEAATIRAYAALPGPMSATFARDYRAARVAQASAFEQLVPLLPALDEKTRASVISLRRSLSDWHVRHDELLGGTLTREQYKNAMPSQQELLSAALQHSHASFSGLNHHTQLARERLAFLTRVQIAATAGLAGLALASVFIAVWLSGRAKRLDAALREQALAERLAVARADVLSWVSHDLKNPLAAISMASTNLRRTLERSPERAPRIVASIDRSALRMSRLIRNLLDGARLDAGRALVMDMRGVDLKDVLLHTCDEAEQGAGGEVKVECELPEALPPVKGDRLRLEQALLNLLHNALRASPAGSAVHVSAELAGSFVRVAVRDEGPGIPNDVLPRLFTPFRAATRSDSTGLGLSIVRAVVEAHGGEVSLETKPEGGTTFYFTVPVLEHEDENEDEDEDEARA